MNNKFNAVKTLYGGVLYDSKKEAHYAMKLDLLVLSDQIKYYTAQHVLKFPFGTKMKIDFRVVMNDDSVEYHEVKGGKATMTPVYKLKKKMAEYYFGIKIKEV